MLEKFYKEKNNIMEDLKRKWKNMKVFILFLTSFILGIAFSQYIGKDINERLLKNNYWNESIEEINKEELDLSSFWKTYHIVKNNYYWIDDIKKKDIVEGMIEGFVKSLDDKHSEYMKIEEKESFEKALSWDFEWIWAIVEKVAMWVKIERLLKGSPAKKYWLRAEDIILEANDIELKDLNIYESVSNIKWPAWTKVMLKIFRPWSLENLEIEVTRAKIKIPSVESKYFEEDNLWYISLNLFWGNTSEEFSKSLKELEEKNIEGLIIDLRDNGWGFLQKAVEILSLLIENWEILVKTKYREDLFSKSYFSINNNDNFDKKIVVLINSNSASASEIVAWALREYNKAILVWEKTYGKWSVQQPFDLESWSLLKLTIARWFTPKWKNIDKEWIEPDIEINFKEEDYENIYDRQLEEWKNILKTFIKKDLLQITIDEEKLRIKKENEIWTLNDNK